jgi:hypothetical protein
MSLAGCMAGFSFSFIFFEARSTHFSRLMGDTRPSVVTTVILWSCCRKLWLCGSSVTGAWSSRTSESSPFGPRMMATLLLFQAMQGGARRLWSPICCWVNSRTGRDLHAPFSSEDSAPCHRLGWSFSVCCVCLCFSSHSLPLYYSIFNGISIGMKLDRPYFLFRLYVIVKRG